MFVHTVATNQISTVQFGVLRVSQTLTEVPIMESCISTVVEKDIFTNLGQKLYNKRTPFQLFLKDFCGIF